MTNLFFTALELAERDHFRETGIGGVEYSIPWFRLQGRSVFLFGSGGAAAMAVRTVFRDFAPVGILDNNPALWGGEKYGFPVMPPAVAKETPGALAVICIDNEPALSDVTRQCRNMGIEAVDWLDCMVRSDARRYRENLEELPEVLGALDLWGDSQSRETYRDLVRFHASFRTDFLPAPAPGPQYFQPFVPYRSYRHFVDVGAYDGDTYRDFRRLLGGDFDAYYAFEPLSENLARLEMEANADPRVHIIAAAVGERAGRASFHTRIPGHSKLGDGGDLEVRATTLDGELRGRTVDCVKMDIEGAEPEALRGGENLLREQTPDLAVCVYHQPDHLWGIPGWLKRTGLPWKLYLRHHSSRVYETVCYAVKTGTGD